MIMLSHDCIIIHTRTIKKYTEPRDWAHRIIRYNYHIIALTHHQIIILWYCQCQVATTSNRQEQVATTSHCKRAGGHQALIQDGDVPWKLLGCNLVPLWCSTVCGTRPENLNHVLWIDRSLSQYTCMGHGRMVVYCLSCESHWTRRGTHLGFDQGKRTGAVKARHPQHCDIKQI